MTTTERPSTRHSTWRLVVLAGTLGLFSSACSGDDDCTVDESYAPSIDPANFVDAIDNPLLPLLPGSHWVYEGGGESIDVQVTTETKVVMGVTCTVVRDVVSEGGEVVEDTYDWFAQDVDGTVWYFGEDSREMEGGEIVGTEGSWEAGVDGAQPGVIMPATPTPGASYRQEYYACEAEDMGEIVSTDESVTVPYGSFTGCLKTRDYTPLEPGADEYKYYCSGVGVVLEEEVSSGDRGPELISFTPGR